MARGDFVKERAVTIYLEHVHVPFFIVEKNFFVY